MTRSTLQSEKFNFYIQHNEDEKYSNLTIPSKQAAYTVGNKQQEKNSIIADSISFMQKTKQDARSIFWYFATYLKSIANQYVHSFTTSRTCA